MSTFTLNKLGFGIVFFAISIGIGSYVLAEIGGQVTENSTADQIIGNGNLSLLDMTEWLPILVVAGVGGLAIAFLITYLGGRD